MRRIANTRSAATVAPIVPSVGTATAYTLDSPGESGSHSWSHTRAVGAGVQVAMIFRSSGNPSPTFSSITFGGEAMTIRAQESINVSGNICCGVATLDPGVGPTSAQTVLVTLSNTACRDAGAYAVDVTDSAGAFQGVADAVDDAGSTTVSVNITPSHAASLLVGMGGCIDGSGTVTEGSGWTSAGTAQSAATAVAIEVRLQSLAPGTTNVTACDVSFNASRTDRAITCAEWLPS